jgi:hypothetical protein
VFDTAGRRDRRTLARRDMGAAKPPVTHQPPTLRHAAMNWAQRLKRVFGIEIDTCRRCGGTLAIIAGIEQPEVIAKIHAHLERSALAHRAGVGACRDAGQRHWPGGGRVRPGARAGFSGCATR